VISSSSSECVAMILQIILVFVENELLWMSRVVVAPQVVKAIPR
jgi:hypothetical protein